MSEAAQTSAAPRRAADRIRDSARELFYRDGIRAVGVEEIVARAGATKPSLYRAFASKDALALDYLTDYESVVWARFDRVAAAHPGDALAQLKAYFRDLDLRVKEPGFRGCAFTNAAVEYPQAGHPARVAAEAHKRALLARLTTLCRDAGAKKPAELAGGLLLLIEGAFSAVQLFGPGGPQDFIASAAEVLIKAYYKGYPERCSAKDSDR